MSRRVEIVMACVLLASFAHGAPAKSRVEIWGVTPSDVVEIDGSVAVVKAGGAFAGDPSAGNAPVARELTAGKHTITLRREGCVPREIAIDVDGSLGRAIVFSPSTERCGIPLAPARAP